MLAAHTLGRIAGVNMSFIPVIKAGRGGITHPDLTDAYGPGAALTVICQVSHLRGGAQAPHFSVTGEIATTESRRRRDIQAGGCLHDEAVRFWPECAPLVAMHSADALSGEPMHAEANGFYWLAGALGGLGERYHGGNADSRYSAPKSPDDCLRVFAKHVRLTLDEARSVAERLDQDTQSTMRRGCPECVGGGLDSRGALCRDCAGTGRENVARFARRRWQEECASMAPRWKRERDAAIAWLWKNAGPTDLRPEWARRSAEHLGATLREHAPCTL